MDVYIAGIAMTRLGRFPHLSVKDLTHMAVSDALADAGCRVEDIDAAWFANTRQGIMEGQNAIRGQCALRDAGLSGLPIFNVENACASSSSAVALARAYIQSGAIEIALVVGAEKMYFPDRPQDAMRAFMGGTDIHAIEETIARFVGMGISVIPADVTAQLTPHSIFMDFYAALARLHMELYATTVEHIAAVAAKNHWHSTMNPLAQYQVDMSVEQVLNDVPIAWPLTRAMCAPLTDGAAAAILCSEAALTRFDRRRAIKIRGIGVSSSTPRPAEALEQHCGKVAAERAYAEASIGPADIHVVEVHDASAFAEILQIENLGLCRRGEGGPFSLSGATKLGGQVPVNPSGGLVSKGHPIAATGLIQLHELVTQLRGEACARQQPNARLAVAENGGGFLGVEEASCVVTVLERTN